MKKIYILTGPVHTGKTTQLMHWAAGQKNIDGVFQPVIENKRFIYHIASRTLKMLERSPDSHKDQVITIGNYFFSRDVFEWSQKILGETLNRKLDWLIIDEIGPIELSGTGLEPAISKIFTDSEKFSGNILCVVRDSILVKFLEHYKLENDHSLFDISDLH